MNHRHIGALRASGKDYKQRPSSLDIPKNGVARIT